MIESNEASKNIKYRYLKPTVILEPLICQWPAWIYLVSPLTAGLYFKNRYLKMLHSFVDQSELQQKICKNTKRISSLFVNLPDEYHEQVKVLSDEMKVNLLPLIALADDILAFHKQLKLSAKGLSLEALYASVPDSLQGAVELLYVNNNYPCIRFIEPILYDRIYDASIQSLMLSCPVDIDARPFAFTTPRLKKSDNIHLKLPFKSTVIDQLVASREIGLDYQSLLNDLDLSSDDRRCIESLFTENEPDLSQDRHFSGGGIRVRYFGHACVLLQTAKTAILIDPLLSNHGIDYTDRYGYFDLPEQIDCVLISHSHPDHIALETLLQLRHKVKRFIVPRNNGGFLPDPSMRQMLKQIGFSNVDTLDEFEKIQIGDVTVTGIPFLGEHGDLNIQSKLAYHLVAKEKSLLFVADSNNIDQQLYKSIRSIIGHVDLLFIGMECQGGPYSCVYGPLSLHSIQRSHDQSRRLSGSNSEKAWSIVNELGVKTAYVYAMALEPWLSYIFGPAPDAASISIIESNKFISQCLENGIKCERLYLKYELLED